MTKKSGNRIRRDAAMNNRAPMAGQQVDVTQASPVVCPCGGGLFDKAYRMGKISSLASGNPTGRDIMTEYVVHVCRECGAVFEGKA